MAFVSFAIAAEFTMLSKPAHPALSYTICITTALAVSWLISLADIPNQSHQMTFTRVLLVILLSGLAGVAMALRQQRVKTH